MFVFYWKKIESDSIVLNFEQDTCRELLLFPYKHFLYWGRKRTLWAALFIRQIFIKNYYVSRLFVWNSWQSSYSYSLHGNLNALVWVTIVLDQVGTWDPFFWAIMAFSSSFALASWQKYYSWY
jgi:hypothetical protein